MDLVDVAGVEANGVPRLCAGVPEAQELVGDLGRPGNLTGTCQTQQQQVHHQPCGISTSDGQY